MTRLLLVPDVKGWAWHRMCEGIAAHSGDVDVTVLDNGEFGVFTHHARWSLDQFDGVCQCSWTESDLGFESFKTTWLASHGFEYDFPNDSPAGRISTRLRNREHAEQKLPQFDRVLCVSDRIHQAALKFTDRAVRVVPGVREDVFVPEWRHSGVRLKAGWCGQASGVTKGCEEVLLPLVEATKHVVEWRVNTRSAQDALNEREMVEWYQGLDVFVSTSCSEGFQMPILEAASCGRPVIATDVGAAAEVVRHGESGFVVSAWNSADGAKRSADWILGHLYDYRNSRDLLVSHGLAARQHVIDNFLWSDRSGEWLEAMLP